MAGVLKGRGATLNPPGRFAATRQQAVDDGWFQESVPDSIATEVRAVEAVAWAEVAAAPGPTLVLFREVADLIRAAGRGLGPALAPAVNRGNVHFGPGRRPVTPSVFLSAAELEAVRDLVEAGFDVEARAIPSDPPAGLGDIERRYAAAP